jgi:DNA-binding transcriptional regulator YdaS (Cro superfamily)
MIIQALKIAIEEAGSQTALANSIGKTQGHISKWLEREYVPAEVVLEIERATGVSRHDLRPDIYPRNEVAA